MPVAVAPRRKILGIGYPRFAIPEWKELAEKYDIHYFIPDERKQVIQEIKRLCDEQGPFDAAYVVCFHPLLNFFHFLWLTHVIL